MNASSVLPMQAFHAVAGQVRQHVAYRPLPYPCNAAALVSWVTASVMLACIWLEQSQALSYAHTASSRTCEPIFWLFQRFAFM